MEITKYKVTYDRAGTKDEYLFVKIKPFDIFIFRYYSRAPAYTTQLEDVLTAAINYESKIGEGATFRSLERLDNNIDDLSMALFFLSAARKKQCNNFVAADIFSAVNNIESAINRLETQTND